MATKETVEMGSRWSVGNGRKVEIFHDKWIPSPDTLKVISPQGQNVNLVKVAQLINGETEMWKVDLIKETFLPHEAEVILGISLSPRLLKDSLLWAWSKNGTFIVRSAYRVALMVLKKASSTREKGDCLDRKKTFEIWKSIWKLNCPNKIKHFLWRSCKNIIPTNFCLASRRVIADGSCGFCGDCELSCHVLWDCKVASEVWKEVGLNLPKLYHPSKDFIDVVWTLKEREGVSDWELFAITTWMVWNNRNVFKNEGRCKEPKRIAKEAREYAMEVA